MASGEKRMKRIVIGITIALLFMFLAIVAALIRMDGLARMWTGIGAGMFMIFFLLSNRADRSES
jgi:hypothetical protein